VKGGRRILLWVFTVELAVIAIGFAVSQVSPWPAALLIRFGFNLQANYVNWALGKHVPPGIGGLLDQRYDESDPDAFLDVFYPSGIQNSDRALPTIVWIHGGGWVSGSRKQVGNYARILASRGYTVVTVDYSLAPGRTYPTPLRQVMAALSWLQQNARRLHIDPLQLILAGDSAGAQIAAQLANIVTAPAYATAIGIKPSIVRPRIRGLLLYCGSYDIGPVRMRGIWGSFLRTLLWSYFGEKTFATDRGLAPAIVTDFVTPTFPPTFIPGGNGDPLTPQSRRLAGALVAQGVPVDTLFYPPDHIPRIMHEYQFNLDHEAGRVALQRSIAFVASRVERRPL